MTIPIAVVDAFASAPFTGNPAGVVVTDAPLPEPLMRSIAGEMKHAETAFLVPGDDAWSLRWFTPEAEVDLCGHATLASAHWLWSSGRAHEPVLRFATRSGVLTAARTPDGRIELDFPSLMATQRETDVHLGAALGVTALETWWSRFDALVVVASEADVVAVKPDFRALRALPVRGVIVTARAEGALDFVSRFFAPAVGVDEDPVTGSAHCVLAPFWAARVGRSVLRAAQRSARGGLVGVEVVGDRVKLRGTAVTVLRGELHTGSEA